MLLIPFAIVGLFFYWKAGWAVDDGIFYPAPARVGLILFPIMAFVVLGLWSITNKLHKITMIGATIAIVGIVASISLLQIAEVFPERFNLYKGERFFSSVTLEDLKNIQESKATGIYHIGNDYCPRCIEFYPTFSSLAGRCKVIIKQYDPIFYNDLMPEQVEDILQSLGVNSIPTVLVITGGIVTHIFDGDNIEEQVKQYFGSCL